MIARETSSKLAQSGRVEPIAAWRPASSRSIGSWWPITLVEGDENVLRPATDLFGGDGRRPPGVRLALGAGGRVGVAGVDDDRADAVGGQQRAVPFHRRGTDPVGRERARRGARAVGHEDRQIETPRRLDPRARRRRLEPARQGMTMANASQPDSSRSSGDIGHRPSSMEGAIGHFPTVSLDATAPCQPPSTEQGCARHVTRCFRRQEDDHRTQFGRVAPALQGHLRLHRRPCHRVVQQRSVDLGGERTRAESIDVHAVGRPLQSQRPGQQRQPPLLATQ